MPLFGRKKTAPLDPKASTDPVAVQAEASVPAPPVEPRALTIDSYREILLAQVRPLRPFGVGLIDAFGQTLCETIKADLDLPTYTAATIDGYAVRAADVAGASPESPVRLPVVDRLDSPFYRGAALTPRTAVEVAVGAPIPEGADAVVALANTDGGEEEVAVTAEVAFNDNLRPAGSDVADGTLLLKSGEVLDAAAIGMLAEAGLDKVLVRPRPRVVVLTVGRDLVAPGEPLTTRAQRYDATTALLAGSARADGAQIYPVGVVADNVAELSDVLSDQLIRADLIVIAGDASPGAPVREVLDDLGEARFERVAMHPGGRQGFALVGDARTPVCVVPAGTVAAFVSYQAFVRPLLRRLSGLAPSDRVLVPMPARSALRGELGVTQLIPVRLTPRGAEVVGDPSRELAFDIAHADALAVLPAAIDVVEAHEDVECWAFSPASR